MAGADMGLFCMAHSRTALQQTLPQGLIKRCTFTMQIKWSNLVVSVEIAVIACTWPNMSSRAEDIEIIQILF